MPFAQHILVALADPSLKNPVGVNRAAAIARRTGAAITLFNSLYSPYIAGESFTAPDELKRDIEAVVNDRKHQLEKHVARLTALGLEARARCRWDYPVHESLVREVLREKIDLVIAESHRHRAAARLLLSNTDWQMIRVCPCPVLFVKSARPYERLRVLAAVDPLHAHAKPEALDHLIIDTGAAIAELFGGRLHAAHFYALTTPFALGPGLEPMPLPVAIAERHAGEVAAAFAALTTRHELPARRTHLRIGLASQELPKLAAKLDAQLVVMGAISRSSLKRLFIGNTAERVIDRLSCDVLVLKPEGFRTPVPRRPSLRPVVLPPL
jgi:universal stress protein E